MKVLAPKFLRMNKSFFAILVLACAGGTFGAQSGSTGTDSNPADSTAAGGQWVRMQHKDPATGTVSVSFVLAGQTIDLERHPAIILACNGPKEPAVIYHTDVKLASQAHNVYDHYAESIWVQLKVDNGKTYRALWEIIPGQDLSSNRAIPDHKTIHYLFAGEKLKVRFRDYQDEDHLDSFELSGLSAGAVRGDCSQSWLAKNDSGDAAKPSHPSRHAEQ
jgi:hypothetical protein